ncbi:DegV family protein [Chloroflexota bacterium]
MPVKVVTDSISDIPAPVAEKLGITVIPLNVHFEKDIYRDGVDLTTCQFYDRLSHNKVLPTTSAPSLSAFSDTYDRLSEEADANLVITISSKLSATYDVALQAVKQMKGKCRVEVVNSQTAIMAEGLLAIAAAKAAQSGATLGEIVDLTQHNISRSELRMAFNTLEYLKRGGRIGQAQAFMGSLLKVNPVIGIKDGEIFPFGRERSRAKAVDQLYNFVMDYSRIEEMAVEDATTPEEAEMLAGRLSSKFPKERIYCSKVSPVIGTHVGPRVLGVAVLGNR